MWRFKTELKEELLDGRTLTYIANKIGITVPTLVCILNGKTTTRKLTAYCIVKVCNKEAIAEDYFEKVK